MTRPESRDSSATATPLVAELPRARDLALLVAATLPLYVNLGYYLWGSESRWLLIARSMLESGNWLDPRLRGEFYGDKPLLSYWAIVVAALPFGRVSEAIARVPSAISGTLTVLVTGWMTARLLGRRYVLPVGLTLATAFSFVYWARSASADLLNLFFVAVATAVYLEGVVRFRRSMIVCFFVLLALGGHAKGTPPIIVPLAIVGSDVLLSRRWDLLRRWRWIAAGAALGTAIYLVPFVFSWLDRGYWDLLGSVWRENFVRAFDPFDHRGSVFLYVYTLPAMLVPWCLWLPGALGWAARRWRSSPGLRFGLTSFVVVFLLFTASKSRRSYYILPIFPFAAILIGAFGSDISALARRDKTARSPGDGTTAIAGAPDLLPALWRILGILPIWILASGSILASSGALIALVVPGEPRELALQVPWLAPAALAILAGGVTTVILLRRERYRGALATEAAIAFVLLTYIFTGVQQLRDQMHAEVAFAVRLHQEYPGREVCYFSGTNGRLAYYVDQDAPSLDSAELARLLESRGEEETLIACGPDGKRWLEKNRKSIVSRELFRVESPGFGRFVQPRLKYVLLSCHRR